MLCQDACHIANTPGAFALCQQMMIDKSHDSYAAAIEEIILRTSIAAKAVAVHARPDSTSCRIGLVTMDARPCSQHII